MATRKSDEERLEEIQRKMTMLKEQEKKLKARQSQKERNERTRRFCILGGEIEKILGRKINDDDVRKIIAFLESQEKRGKFFSSAVDRT